jgi:hypothetical protein
MAPPPRKKAGKGKRRGDNDDEYSARTQSLQKPPDQEKLTDQVEHAAIFYLAHHQRTDSRTHSLSSSSLGTQRGVHSEPQHSRPAKGQEPRSLGLCRKVKGPLYSSTLCEANWKSDI